MKHEKRTTGERIVALTAITAILGFVFAKHIENELKPVNCEGIQTLPIESGDTFDGLADNVNRHNVSKDEVVEILIDINPAKQIGNLIVGDTIIAPVTCVK